MVQQRNIPIRDYSYKLPEEKIAGFPLEKRDQSKLLVYKDSKITEDSFMNINTHLPEKCRLFYNNTRVIHARLKFRKSTGALIEIFCLAPHDPSEYQTSFSQTETCTWKCMIGNLKKWKSEILNLDVSLDNQTICLRAEKLESGKEYVLVRFSWKGGVSFGKLLDKSGDIPIPPYLKRESEEIDNVRYQTIFSKLDGSVAAPTAGLHFTPGVFQKLRQKSISLHEITLHVGAGTFQPVKSENAMEHPMHEETFTVTGETLKYLAETEHPFVATGTTTLRTLESLYWLGVKSLKRKKLTTRLNQWDYKNLEPLPVKEAVEALIVFLEKENLQSFTAVTAIMIVPGYSFKIVNGLITNYHQPQSTLLLLVAAFVGEHWKSVYTYALNHDFRFLSYGDSSLLWRE